jgi:hypothetical protein
LVDALKSLISKPVEKPTVKPAIISIQSAPNRWPAVPIQDAVIAALHNQWKPLYSEMLALQARIYDVAEVAEKYNDPLKLQESCTMAFKITELDELIDEIYFKRDYYNEHGRLPEQKVTHEPVAPHMWPMKLENAKRYVRYYQNKLKSNPGDEKAAVKLQQYQGEVIHYKKLLNPP